MKWHLNSVLINQISKGSIPFSAAGPIQAAYMQRSSTSIERYRHRDHWEHWSFPKYYQQSVYPQKEKKIVLLPCQQLRGHEESQRPLAHEGSGAAVAVWGHQPVQRWKNIMMSQAGTIWCFHCRVEAAGPHVVPAMSSCSLFNYYRALDEPNDFHIR